MDWRSYVPPMSARSRWFVAFTGLFVGTLAPIGAALASEAGPIPALVGSWESLAPRNAFQMRVTWNESLRRYEGALIVEGVASAAVGFPLGEVCWLATPAPDGSSAAVQEEWRSGANGMTTRSQWRQTSLVRLTPSELATSISQFRRVGSERPATGPSGLGGPTPPAAAPGGPAHVFLLGRQAPLVEPPAAGPENPAALPGVSDVLQKVTGRDPSDTVARQFAACKLLAEILNKVKYPTSEGRRAAQGLMRDYMNTQGLSRRQLGPAGQPIADAYVKNPFFRNHLVHVDFPAVGVYLDAQQKKVDDAMAAARAAQEAKNAAAAEEARRTAEEQAAKEQQELEATRGDRESVKRDIARAKNKGVDTTVFGIPLGEPLSLPPCGGSVDGMSLLTGIGSGAAKTCAGDVTGDLAGALLHGLARSIAGSNVPEATKYWRQTSIRLADDKCPDWVKVSGMCLVFATLEGGVVISAFVSTGDERLEDTIEGKLTAKYHKKPERPSATSCTSYGRKREADVREWNLPGLHVTYEAIQEDCVHGQITVETDTARAAFLKARREHEENEGKF